MKVEGVTKEGEEEQPWDKIKVRINEGREQHTSHHHQIPV